MKAEQFEDLIVWQESKALYIQIYTAFEKHKLYFFKDQILRAALSISNNIAEGFERKGSKEFINFLSMAKGSVGEVRSMLRIAVELKYIEDGIAEKLIEHSIYVSKLLYKFMQAIKEYDTSLSRF